MSATLIPIWSGTDILRRKARTFRELAASRWRAAVTQLEIGGEGARVQFHSMLRDVDAFEKRARGLEQQVERIEALRVATVAAIDDILKRSGRDNRGGRAHGGAGS